MLTRVTTDITEEIVTDFMESAAESGKSFY